MRNSDKTVENYIDIGSCVKIKNSMKTFQVIGINHKKSICWIREWPIKNSGYKTFALSIQNIMLT